MAGIGRQTDFPLRFLVKSDMVGAIIGRHGNCIRAITQDSRARVDVDRREAPEKTITVYGNPDNCSLACRRIMQVMAHEAIIGKKGDISLKILAHNNLIGRVIGKAGKNIKRIMSETQTKIVVSSINEINNFHPERVITVYGDIHCMSAAESQISAKLRQSYEYYLQAITPQSLVFPGLEPVQYQHNILYAHQGAYAEAPTPIIYSNDLPEMATLYVPNNAVGAIIGRRGSYIRSIMHFSNTSLKITPPDRYIDRQAERKVTIVGTPEGQWKAQYMIFERMREEGFTSGNDDVHLTVEILVATSHVGRIIGRGGQNVRELQRLTGSVIKLPDFDVISVSGGDHQTPVYIMGSFYSVQSAQRRIRAMIIASNPPPANRKPKEHRNAYAYANFDDDVLDDVNNIGVNVSDNMHETEFVDQATETDNIDIVYDDHGSTREACI